MTAQEILCHVDHTLLKADATTAEMTQLCEEALRCHTASVCVNPRFVASAKQLLGGDVAVCTVIGFPLGATTTAAKVFETQNAVANGADELDLVISVGTLREGADKAVLEELLAVRNACKGKVLKVIVETCLLSDAEKQRICHLIAQSGADYIKTSTGFSTGGATKEDISLFSSLIQAHRYPLKIKASGGIRTREAMELLLSCGADRLGCSAAVSLLEGAV